MESSNNLNIIEKLVENIDYDILIEKCVNKKLIFDEMVDKLKMNAENNTARHKNLVKLISEQGTKSLELFKTMCESEFKTILDENKSQEGETYDGKGISKYFSCFGESTEKQIIRDISLEPYNGAINRSLKVRHASHFCVTNIPELETYSMKGKHRGVFFLVNIINYNNHDKRRNGAEVDKDRLLDLFSQMGFTLFYYEDPTFDEFKILLQKLSQSDYLRVTESFVFIMLSHGGLIGHETLVEFGSGVYYPTENIFEYFTNSNCTYLKGKPKIFMFSCCRGDKPDKCIESVQTTHDHEHDHSNVVGGKISCIPTYYDIAICYATVPGFRTHRHPETGSWFIKRFCEIFEKHAHNLDFDSLMKIVGQKVCNHNNECGSIQTASVEYRGFQKVLYFNPGIYGIDETNEVNA